MFKKVYFLIFSALVLIASCKQPLEVERTGSVQFGASGQDVAGSLSSGSSRGPVLPGVTQMVVSIEKAEGGAQVTDLVLDISNFGGNALSETLALPVGDYLLTKFLLQDSEGNTLYATPLEGSAKAYLVSDPLPLAFSVTEGDTTIVTPEVISTVGGTPGEFGYVTFDYIVVEVFDVLIRVQIPGVGGYVDTEATLTVMNGEVELYSGELTADMNQITLNDGIESYTVTVSKDGYETFTETYTTVEMKAFLSLPLFISLLPETLEVVAIASIEVTFLGLSVDGTGDSEWYLDQVSAAGDSIARLANVTETPFFMIGTVTFDLSTPISAGEYFAFAWSGEMSERIGVVDCYDEDGVLLKSFEVTLFGNAVLRLADYAIPDTYLRFNHTGSDIVSSSEIL